jgi:16S rRNA (cytosine1402-N4)-methyltransferase
LNGLGPAGRLLAIDRDPQAVADAGRTLVADDRFDIVKGEFAQLEDIAKAHGLVGRVDGLLLDLGVSSPQLDEAGRGFSFLRDGPLDMRMDPESGSSAAQWLATVDEKELRKVLFDFGEEKFAARIARAIVAARDAVPIKRTLQLAELVAKSVPASRERKHPATRTFQAIRIAVNRELEQLEQALHASLALLAGRGRLCVISFHSLEDRRVKRFMRNASRESEQYRGMPDVPEEHRPPLRVVGKPVTATAAEITANPRARSARLRIAERLQ